MSLTISQKYINFATECLIRGYFNLEIEEREKRMEKLLEELGYSQK